MDGACQPNLENFPQRDIDGIMHRFNRSWYDEFKWLEYSIDKDAAFCLYCYIFKNELRQGGGDAFTLTGFRDWKNKSKFRKHEGGLNSAHRQAFSKCEDLLNQKQHIEPIMLKTSDERKMDYKERLIASIDCDRWLLKQGLAFRGHDESEESSNQGNFLELLKFLANHNEDVRRVALNNAPRNLKLIAPRIQKYIVRACVSETTKSIRENPTAYFVHCFAHQLQLVLVEIAKNHIRISELFLLMTNVVNVVGGSCKRKDNLREQQAANILEALESEELNSGRGLNQESTLTRPCDTRWSSHYTTILGMINLFGSIIGVLRTIVNEGALSSQRGEASRLVRDMLSFDFVFDLHLMKSVLGITNESCKALQRKDQDIVIAMDLVHNCKERFQAMRDGELSSLMKDVSAVCVKYKIDVLDMDALYVSGKRLKLK